MLTHINNARFGSASTSISTYEAAIKQGSNPSILEGFRFSALNDISKISSSKAVLAWSYMDELDSKWGREATGLVSSGGAGKTASVHINMLPLVRAAKIRAVKLAHYHLGMDPRAVRFLNMHFARSGDLAAKVLAQILTEDMPEGKKAPVEKAAGGLYGFPTRTARLALLACLDLTAYCGELTFKAHATHSNYHLPMKTTLASSDDSSAKLLLATYPQDKVAGEVPDHLKEYQFTKENNPNPKGSDADGDGKSGEKPDFLKGDKKGNFDAETIGEKVKGPIDNGSGDTFMQGHFTQENNSNVEGVIKSAAPTSVRGWLEWEPE